MSDAPAAKIAVYEAQRAHEIELNRATAAFEHATLSPLFLLNGGATVAFLTLLGAAATRDSTLDINPWLSALAALAWSSGLLASTWAARTGYGAQREFSRSVRLRRQLIERQLIRGSDHDFIASLTPLPSESAAMQLSPTDDLGAAIPALDDPRTPLTEARALQDRYLRLSAQACGSFLVGVLLAAVAVVIGS